jgi:hypothetical protein
MNKEIKQLQEKRERIMELTDIILKFNKHSGIWIENTKGDIIVDATVKVCKECGGIIVECDYIKIIKEFLNRLREIKELFK